ncbi:uncharacterized protein BJ212DRAFT_1490311 [Suillus subaureus]|uniref:Uncharacterized protein n=1 Tax=Suillus subaureus TaxID=48587 RepID=A0A9P7DI76_9AGAM|nr:uncharacterized protein BJ212DRAFT_1490311 [Suillus subaureus]KAG1793750.1 hypothetical protein BJ212DRAFT_1490311 [Suillus subaureus]
MQRSLLFNVLAFMVVLAVAYPMSGAITERSSVARREDEARGVYFPISYDNNKKRSEDDAILYPMLLKERSYKSERSEDDAILYPVLLKERSSEDDVILYSMLFKERSSAGERSEDDAIFYPMLFKERSSAVDRSEDDAILYPMKQ